MIVTSKVPVRFDRAGLVAYLARRFTYLDEAAWRELVAAGKITRGGQPCGVDWRVTAGEELGAELPPFREPEADLNYRIVYEDAWLLAVDKPGNLLVHRRGRSLTSNLIYQLRYVQPPLYSGANIVNRLDRETSGLVLVAKERESTRELNRQLAAQEMGKEYLAVVWGTPQPASGEISLAIGTRPEGLVPYRRGTGEVQAPQAAHTVYETVAPAGPEMTLLLLRPKTGRTHQLRVHLAAIGHPLAGDKLYGLSEAEYLEWRDHGRDCSARLGFGRQALHCRRLEFIHPHTGLAMAVEAPLPPDMAGLLARENGARGEVSNIP